MMYGVLLVVHVLVAFFLIAVILLQGGRGGLGEALGGAGAQSLFGGGANIVMSRITAGCAGAFMITCLSLAMLSTARGQSVIDRLPTSANELPPLPLPGAPGSASLTPVTGNTKTPKPVTSPAPTPQPVATPASPSEGPPPAPAPAPSNP